MTTGPLGIAIRADASTRSGLGHVKRCVALGHALRELGCQVTVVSRATDVDVSGIVREAGLEHLPLAAASGADLAAYEGAAPVQEQDLDVADTVRGLRMGRPSWVVVDHYALGSAWHSAVRAQLAASIGVIDDLADRPLRADWVLNQNLCAKRSLYEQDAAGRPHLLCGPRFALLDPHYVNASRCEVDAGVRSIGIFMGGVDRANLSMRALEACREVASFSGPIEIACTSANPHLAELREACRAWPQTSLLLDAPNLAGFFARHGLQIGSGGSSTWERCCVGAPMLLLLAAENQRAVIPGVAALGAAAVLDPLEAVDPATIGHAVQALLRDDARRRRMSEAGRRLVDGLGAQRAALSLAASAITVRRACIADGPLVHAWRNAQATRSVSFDSRDIPFEEHMRWLERALADPRRLVLLGQVGQRPVGVIRFDSEAGGWAEVSLYLDPTLHGLGLGGTMLVAGEAAAVECGVAPAGFVARVRADNARSAEMFAAAGYEDREGAWRKGHRAATTGVRLQ